MENLAKQVKILKIYAAILTLVVLALIVYVFTLNGGHYKELTAERINIVEKNGALKMVISNGERQHPGRLDNKDFDKRSRPPGLIFFNDEGDEDGGLVYDGNKDAASMVYSFDQYKNDQIMQLRYLQEKYEGKIHRTYGLNLWDRDDFSTWKQFYFYDSVKKLKDTAAFNHGMRELRAHTRQRFFAGKNDKGEVGLFLNDSNGKPRLNIYINNKNQPVIETLDENGKVVNSR